MMAGAAGGTLAVSLFPPSIQRALAIPAFSRTRSIQDVEHIVVFMQENRSFDHYYGTLRGVRGYADRFPIRLPNGKPVWHQPRKGEPDATVLPFRLDTFTTSAQCVGDLDHSWYKTHAAINNGRYNAWPDNKTNMTMGYHNREDLPFHYALADAFTICDNYFCATPTQTHPNRTYLMTAMVDPTGKGGGPLIDNNDVVDDTKLPPFTWTTYPERLQDAGVSWQIYQQGLDWTDPYNGNFGTNVLANFQQYIDAKPGTPLHDRGMSVRSLDQLKADVRANKLPQVSWLLPPEMFSEHPRATPGYGAQYTAQILDALTSNPESWSKTVLFIMYDENDGFFDHLVPPQPPMSRADGLSTVTVHGERHDCVNPRHKPIYTEDNLPYGLGPRVPMTVVSPWTKGGFVCSQVFDHTSVIRFIETRFGVKEPNITPWRRAVCGDLTAALDFERADGSVPNLPNTADYRALADEQCKLSKPQVPEVTAQQSLPVQERGTRWARALPYELHADSRVDANGALHVAFRNTGSYAAHFQAYAADPAQQPRRYTVEAGKSVADTWPPDKTGAHDLWVHGPNGFFRQFKGSAKQSIAATFGFDTVAGALTIDVQNPRAAAENVVITDNAYGQGHRTLRVPAKGSARKSWPIATSNHWYDLTLTDATGTTLRAAGHMETGKPSTTDPALGA